MNYHIVYNNFKDYAELFIKNIDFSKANINKVLFLHIGDEEAISEIIENTNFKNAEFYIKDEDSIYDIIETLYNEKVHKFLEYNNMEFDLIIANPPYGSLGNPIISEAISHLADKGTASVLMPLSCYKKNELYRHVETFNLANPKLFKDAVITENLCITTCKKNTIDKYNWMDLVLKSVDQNYIEYYKYNIEHSIGLVPKQIRDEQLLPENLNNHRNEWFIESLRCSQKSSGGGFGEGSSSYKWNTSKADLDIAFVFMIDLKSEFSKDNFIKYWYNGKKTESLASKVILGTKNDNFVGSSYFAIPQIDWANIHINQKELWDNGLYDEAVLAEMNLKWNDDRTEIVQV